MAGQANATTPTGPPGSCAIGAPDDERLLDDVLGDDPEASEEAFRALVSRHGPMVLRVCRQVLGQEQDAEDVFQATFLVLARGASSIRNRRALGGWLHEIARRLAVRVKAGSARRRAMEMEAAEMSAGEYRSEGGWADLRPVIHEEVDRLPEVYRDAVVLCYLEGRTNEEAAALLRWPVGTVKGRLSRARALLRSRLGRRGVALAGLWMARISPEAAIAEVVPADLSGTTVRAVVTFAREGPDGLATAVSCRVRELVGHELGSATRPAPRAGTALLLVAVAAVLLLVGVAAASGGGDATYRGLLGFFDRPAHAACHRAR
jgi:RNA polymerase sigma factor (sigma-70 family)